MKVITYLIDSDMVVDWLKGKPQVIQLLSSLEDQGFAISIISYGEVYEGIYYGADQKRHMQGLRSFLKDVEVLPLTRPIMERFAQLRGQLRGAGNIIGDFDLLIASTAIHHNLTLVTRNIKHYQRVPELTLYQSSSFS